VLGRDISLVIPVPHEYNSTDKDECKTRPSQDNTRQYNTKTTQEDVMDHCVICYIKTRIQINDSLNFMSVFAPPFLAIYIMFSQDHSDASDRQ
jgi:hypothetical protein